MSVRFDPVGRVRSALRNSPWILIALMLHVVFVAVLSIVYVQHTRQKEAASPIQLGVAARTEPKVDIPPESPTPPERVPLARPDEGELTPDDLPDLPPEMAPSIEDLMKEVGDPETDPDDFRPTVKTSSDPIGPGGPGSRGSDVTTIRRKRLGPLGPDNGGLPPGRRPLGPTIPTERAVLGGLRWLVRHQNPDGSWRAQSLSERCDPGRPCGGDLTAAANHYDEGLTGLAVLCFLGAGYGHESRQTIVDPVRGRPVRVGEVVKAGLRWLKNRQKTDGSFSADRPFMYNEALATMALSEAYGLSGSRYWLDSAQRGVDFLVRAQRPSPDGKGLWGWRYASRSEVEDRTTPDAEAYRKELHDSDSSVTAWVVMALKSAEMCGLKVPPAPYGGALAFTRWATGGNGLVGYLDAKGAGLKVSGPHDEFVYHVAGMSALGMCTRIFSEKNPDDPFLELAARQLTSDLPQAPKDGLTVDYYYWYYGTLALHQFDGPESPRRTGKFWNRWNDAVVGSVLPLQDAAERACSNGAWLTPDRWSYAGGPIYATAINTLTLEVYYRYPNAFGNRKTKSSPVESRPANPRKPD